MKIVGVELWCRDCQHTIRFEDEYDAPNGGHNYKCPHCGKIMRRSPFVICHCGITVYLSHGDTECENCGQAYNAFGDTITHIGFTEDDF